MVYITENKLPQCDVKVNYSLNNLSMSDRKLYLTEFKLCCVCLLFAGIWSGDT